MFLNRIYGVSSDLKLLDVGFRTAESSILELSIRLGRQLTHRSNGL